MYILDTDHISIIESRRGIEFANIIRRISAIDRSQLHVTIVSFHEQVTGWNRYLSNAVKPEGVVKGYTQLERLLENFSKASLVPFSTAAAEIFEDLRKQKVRLATMDLRIASIAIANQMTLLTRNAVDFERVPNLTFEDWTVT